MAQIADPELLPQSSLQLIVSMSSSQMLVDDQPEAKVEPSPLTREIEKSFRHR